MFTGTYYNSIDSKNRIIVPAKMRSGLGDRCAVTVGFDKCLVIYTYEDFEKEAKKYAEVQETDLAIWSFIRDRFRIAEICEFDGQGRIIIPERLKERVGIKKDLITMGVMSKIEIWSKEVWESPVENKRFTLEEQLAALKEKGL